MMKMAWVAGVTAGALLVAPIGVPTAGAVAPMGGSAADTVDWLRDQGYHVQLNGDPNGSLSNCVATGVHGLRGSHVGADGERIDTGRLDIAYVDLSCNDTV